MTMTIKTFGGEIHLGDKLHRFEVLEDRLVVLTDSAKEAKALLKSLENCMCGKQEQSPEPVKAPAAPPEPPPTQLAPDEIPVRQQENNKQPPPDLSEELVKADTLLSLIQIFIKDNDMETPLTSDDQVVFMVNSFTRAREHVPLLMSIKEDRLRTRVERTLVAHDLLEV